VLEDVVFAALMLGGLFVLFVFKPLHTKLVARDFVRAVKQGKALRALQFNAGWQI
jgi:hypothetical protein